MLILPINNQGKTKLYKYTDNFLKNLEPHEQKLIKEKIDEIGTHSNDMEERLHKWFGNFKKTEQKKLALKIFLEIDFFSKTRIEDTLEAYKIQLKQYLEKKDKDLDDVIIVIPDSNTDSANSHAYELAKKWNILENSVLKIKDVTSEKLRNKYLVLFNDTHGTGNQFTKHFSTLIDKVGSSNCFIVCYSLHKQAFEKFQSRFPNITIIPEIPTPSIKNNKSFTSDEVEMVKSLGKEIYDPNTPLGYGNCGLLVAYDFQCPNNTLPIIWADGENNSYKTETGEEKKYPWTPLFRYKPKRKSNKKSELDEPILPDNPKEKLNEESQSDKSKDKKSDDKPYSNVITFPTTKPEKKSNEEPKPDRTKSPDNPNKEPQNILNFERVKNKKYTLPEQSKLTNLEKQVVEKTCDSLNYLNIIKNNKVPEDQKNVVRRHIDEIQNSLRQLDEEYDKMLPLHEAILAKEKTSIAHTQLEELAGKFLNEDGSINNVINCLKSLINSFNGTSKAT